MTKRTTQSFVSAAIGAWLCYQRHRRTPAPTVFKHFPCYAQVIVIRPIRLIAPVA